MEILCPNCRTPSDLRSSICNDCGRPLIPALIDTAKDRSLIVVGDVMLDVEIYARTSSAGQISKYRPSWITPIYETRKEWRWSKAGAAAMTAKSISIFTPKVHLYGMWGSDIEGRYLEDDLRNSEIGFLRLSNGRDTIVKRRYHESPDGLIARTANIFRCDIDYEELCRPVDESLVDKFFTDMIRLRKKSPQIHSIVVWDFDKGFISNYLLRKLKNLRTKNGWKNTQLIVKPKKKWRKYRDLEIDTIVASWDDAIAGARLVRSKGASERELSLRRAPPSQADVDGLFRDLFDALPKCKSFVVPFRRTGKIFAGIRDLKFETTASWDLLVTKPADLGVSHGYIELLASVISVFLAPDQEEKEIWRAIYLAGVIAGLQLEVQAYELIDRKGIEERLVENKDYLRARLWPEPIGKSPNRIPLRGEAKIQAILQRLEKGLKFEKAKTELLGFFTIELNNKLNQFLGAIRHVLSQPGLEKIPLVLLVSGVPGAGKSTFVKLLAKYLNLYVKQYVRIDATKPKLELIDALSKYDFIYVDELDKEESTPYQERMSVPLDQKFSKTKIVVVSAACIPNRLRSLIILDLRRRVRMNELKFHISSIRKRLRDLPYLIVAMMWAIKKDENQLPKSMSLKTLEILLRHKYPRQMTDVKEISKSLAEFQDVDSTCMQKMFPRIPLRFMKYKTDKERLTLEWKKWFK